VEGKVFSKALRDADGKAVTTRKAAEQAQVREMAVFKVADQAAVLESIAGKLDGRRAELARLADEQNPPLAMENAWTVYVASPNRPDTGPDTLAVYQGQFGQFVRWVKETHAGVASLRDVSQDLAEEYAGHLNKIRLSPNTFNKHVRVLELVFRVLKRKGRFVENPWESIQRKKLETSSRRELTVEELRRVCQNATGEFRVLFAVGVYTGLRLKDCVSLQWGEVDLQRGFIRRVPSKTARRNPKPVIIPIHGSLRAILGAVKRTQGEEYVLPETGRAYLSGGTGKKGVIDRIQQHFIAQGVRVHKAGTGPEAGRSEAEEVKGERGTKAPTRRPKRAKPGTTKRAVVEVGFHSLRHTFVSLCRESNAPLAVVESIVGHSNPAMTRHYTHVGELAAGQAVAALPSVMGQSTPAPATNRHEPESVLGKVRIVLEGMTAANWEQGRSEALALLSAVAVSANRQN
jgi:integrase